LLRFTDGVGKPVEHHGDQAQEADQHAHFARLTPLIQAAALTPITSSVKAMRTG